MEEEKREDLVRPEPMPAARPVKIEPPLAQKLRERALPVLLCAGLAGALYAALFTKMSYRGLNVVLFTLVWLGCTWVSLRQLEIAKPRSFLLLGGGAVLLALSTFLTANRGVQIVNGLGIFILLNLLLLDHFCDRKEWGFGQTIAAFFYLFINGIANLGKPFSHMIALRGKDTPGRKKIRSVLLGLLISLPLAAVVVALLSAADELFRGVTDALFDWDVSVADFIETAIIALILFACVSLGFYALLAGASNTAPNPDEPRGKKREPIVAITFTAVLLAIYLVFCWFQIRYLFLGLLRGGEMTLPNGVSFAGYAREGFFQLLFVSGGNLVLVLICCAVFGESKALKAILTAICATTYVMIASSACRMFLYTGEYGLTFLRLLVLWFLVVLTILFAGTLVFIYRRKFPLFRFCLTVCLTLWLVFSFARPDRIAAEYNYNRFGIWSDSAHDLRYEFSYDAAPVAVRMAKENVDFHLELIRLRYEQEVDLCQEEAGFRGFNLSLWQAVRELDTLAPHN